MFSCEFYEIFKNTFFTERLRATASGYVIFWKLNSLLDYEAEVAFPFEKHINPEKMKFSIKDFFSKCNQIRRKLRIWSHLLKKCLMENFIFCSL